MILPKFGHYNTKSCITFLHLTYGIWIKSSAREPEGSMNDINFQVLALRSHGPLIFELLLVCFVRV